MIGFARKSLGRRGEDMACAALKRRGYRIVDRNVRLSTGELDIIARHRGVIVFIEVKTRSSDAFGSPADAVGPDKRRRLTRLAFEWLQANDLTDSAARFDVVAVRMGRGRRGEVEIIENAFEAQLWN